MGYEVKAGEMNSGLHAIEMTPRVWLAAPIHDGKA
jgi:hypothetical protein